MAKKSLAKRVRILKFQPDGHVVSTKLDGSSGSDKPKAKKIPAWAKPLEKQTRRHLRAMQAFADRALQLHEKSNRKKKNGWLMDQHDNFHRASITARKQLQTGSNSGGVPVVVRIGYNGL